MCKCFVPIAMLLAGVLPSGIAAEFQNLDFEQAMVPPTPDGAFGGPVDPALAFPGWTMGTDGTAIHNVTIYNTLTLGSVAQVLVGPNFPNGIGYTALEGSYSALLQFGPSPVFGTPALSQTGLVPADARFITFLAPTIHNDARVTLDGIVILLFPLGDGRLAADVSAFAGREANLMFSTTSYNGNWLYFDDIRFSPVPEPSTTVLLVIGVVLVGIRWRVNRKRV